MILRKLVLFSLSAWMLSCGTEPTPTYTISTASSPTQAGSVSYSPTGSSQDEGTSITFTATPSEGYLFSQWQGDLSGSTNPASLTLNKNVSVTGVFEKRTYPLTITIVGEGTVKEEVIQAKTDYEHGTTVRLTAQPAEGWQFNGWTGSIQSTEPVQEVTITEVVTVTATFEKRSYPLTITIEGEGTVKERVIQAKTDYEFGTIVELIAQPSEGWQFTGWSGDIESNENPIQVEVKESFNLTAKFSFAGYSATRHSIFIPFSEFPSLNHLSATINEVSGGFVINLSGNVFFIRPGVAAYESASGIEEVDPSPSIILKKEDGSWNLLKVDKGIYSWTIRNYAVDNDIITLGDGNEIGPNDRSNRWKGDVWQGIINNLGGITWTRVTTNENRSYHHGLATGDINGDGLIDISTGPQVYDPSTGDPIGQSIWINNGNGTFDWKYDLLPNDAPRPFGLAFADLDGDLKDEIILGGNAEGFRSTNYVHIYKLNNEGTSYELYLKLSDNTLWDYGMFTTKILTFDFNNDGYLDIIQYQADNSGEGFDVWLGNSLGGFSPHFSKFFEFPVLSSSDFEVFDANKDGYLDVLLRPSGYNSLFRVNSSEYRVEVTNGIKLNNLIWLNDGTGKFNNYNLVDLVLDKELDGKPFHPKYVVPFIENNELHFLAVEGTNIIVNNTLEFTVYDIRVFFE